MYHTQEKRKYLLTEPIYCKKPNAWLGRGYYFWYSEDDAIFWGVSHKNSSSGLFQIYSAEINFDNVLDTVFNEEGYLFWIKQIERAIHYIVKRRDVTLKDINDFFCDKGVFSEIDGVMFQDISNNPDHYFVHNFQYKKRIQLAVYNLHIVSDFVLCKEEKCY